MWWWSLSFNPAHSWNCHGTRPFLTVGLLSFSCDGLPRFSSISMGCSAPRSGLSSNFPRATADLAQVVSRTCAVADCSVVVALAAVSTDVFFGYCEAHERRSFLAKSERVELSL